jgi:hypothetical protein
MSADEEETMPLPGPGRFLVHRRWKRTGGLSETSPFKVTMDVEMDDDGVRWVHGVFIAPLPNWPGLDIATLAQIQLDVELEGLLQTEAIVTTMETRGPTLEEIEKNGDAEWDALRREVNTGVEKAAKSATRRRRPTRELLAKVLELYDKGGIKAVQAETNYSESYCFKLLRRARQEVES